MSGCSRTSPSRRHSCSRSFYMARLPGSSRRRRRSAGTRLATILDACDRATREAQTHVAIPRRFSLGVREMFALQPRLEHPRGRRALRVLEHPRFRAAYDLLLLRAQFGLAPPEMAQWWTRLQEVSPRSAAAWRTRSPATPAPRPGARRRGRRRRRGAAPVPADPGAGRSGSPPTWDWAATSPTRSGRSTQPAAPRAAAAHAPGAGLAPLPLAPVRPGGAAGLRQRGRRAADAAERRRTCCRNCAPSRARSAGRPSASAGARASSTSICWRMRASGEPMQT